MDWISVKDRLPENEQIVLACAERKQGNGTWKRVICAFYTDGTVADEDSAYCWDHGSLDMKYDEEKDMYIVPGGWWEGVQYTEEFGGVDDHVTHWMPLPEPPKED